MTSPNPDSTATALREITAARDMILRLGSVPLHFLESTRLQALQHADAAIVWLTGVAETTAAPLTVGVSVPLREIIDDLSEMGVLPPIGPFCRVPEVRGILNDAETRRGEPHYHDCSNCGCCVLPGGDDCDPCHWEPKP